MGLLVLLLGACAAPGPQREQSESEAQPDSGAGPETATQEDEARGPLDTSGSVRHQVDNRAVAMLWDKAESARRAQRTEDAVAALEEAVKLAPEDPVLWSRLAEMRLRQQDFAVAENLAAKSNALAGERRLLRYRNWVLIAEARSRRGDKAGAEKARGRAERLRRGEGSGQSSRSRAPVALAAAASPSAPPFQRAPRSLG